MKIRKWCNRLLTLGLSIALISSTITGTVAVFQEKSGYIRFDGVNDYVDCGIGVDQTISGFLTVSYWFKSTGTPKWSNVMVQDLGSYKWIVGYENNLMMYVRTASGVTNTPRISGYMDGNWHNVVSVYDKTATQRLKVYVGGVLESQATGFPEDIVPSTDKLYMGTQFNALTGHIFNGAIDEVMIYNRALGSLEIQHNATHRLPYDTTGLVLWLKMNECVGDTAFDSSVHGNHGVLVNNPLWRWGSPFEAIIQ